MTMWPDRKRFAVTLSFDLDAETAWESSSLDGRRLTLLSMGAYGRRVGVPRILELLAKYDVRAQFYIPALIAERDPNVVRGIAEAGHGIGCHGYFHERVDEHTPEQNLRILRDSKAVLERTIGREVNHYRAPVWEITPDVISSLIELGFRSDSSLMGDDRPYLVGGEPGQLLELPVSWALDDWEQFAYSAEPAMGGVIEAPDKVLSLWTAEMEGMREYGGHFILTMHPQLIGRPSRLLMLERLIQRIQQNDDAWWCTPDDVYEQVRKGALDLPIHPY
ncbi:polysaccharide deacetylase [Pseudomonas protegens]|uniref:Polysaccharide deacetylase n=1 Tax=Pseudomonas protegens TaxID=380021 RepID=A0A7G8YMV5_9PSED|nr:polysaccharide deacetylase [Pseudomonas protegens]QNH77004.1 polysaccharide deacetylase [Pseudomonas protegens]QNL06199.1 polysaccharide deacetylase [Pseudomonas protegens]RBJ82292.1 polysaccharide deacetylase [Pseudomonas sp. MWU12-2534b]